ncbi:nucleotidyl transferase [Gorgonomyces haynaldii]|nr:nucleotidyl transferase [Gorgonomyces haynaldii]
MPQVNVLIPMAGAGSRFAKAGYKDPKPLIPVFGKPMIQTVINNMNIKDAHYIFVVQEKHAEEYGLDKLLPEFAPGCDIVKINGLTEGAACTVLCAEKLINNDIPLLTANSDQFLEWNAQEYVDKCLNDPECDGLISTFIKEDPDTKWSYAKLNEKGHVTEVQEKVPISKYATTGIYMWKKGSDYVKYARQMIEKNIRANNEFYVCPVYNEGIKDGKIYKIEHCKRMWGIGVPDDLEFFLKNYKP